MTLEAFAGALDDGVAAGVLADDDGVRGMERRAVRTWLHLLGYLPRDNGRDALDEALGRALRAFRVDLELAGSDQDLDAATLSQLRRLVAFDPELEPDTRFDGIAAGNPALHRAVGLRLYALGLLPRLPAHTDHEDIRRGMARFADICALLGLAAPRTQDLFDLEALSIRLAQDEQHLTIMHSPGASDRDRSNNRTLIREFVQAVARIELWLIGYLTRPRRNLWARDAVNKSLPHALRQFWRDQPVDSHPPSAQREHLDGRFFRRVRLVMSAQTADAGDDDEVIVDQLLNEPDLARSVSLATKSLGARLLDGIRRAARFVIGWIRLKLRGILALARNLARIIVVRIGAVFAAVAGLVRAVPHIWSFLTRRPVDGSHPQHLTVLTDADFDVLLIAHPEGETGRVVAVGRRLHMAARLFASVTALISRLISTFVRISRRTAVGGWFGMVVTLLHAWAWLTEMKALTARVRTDLTELTVTSSPNPVGVFRASPSV